MTKVFCFHVVASVLLLFSQSTACRAQSSDRAEFKRKTVQSMSDLPARQSFRLGPLADGRSIEGRIQYLDNTRGIGIRRARDGSICINFDRRYAAVANFVIDASINCQQFGKCERLPGYVAKLVQHSGSVGTLPLIEDFEPSLAPQLAAWKLTDPYARAWLTAFESFIVTIQQHEIAHAALVHKVAVDRKQALKQEAEADGFAAYVSHLVGYSNAAGAAIVLDGVVAPTGSVETACRVEALVLDLRQWFRRNALSHRLARSLQDRPVLERFKSRFDFSVALGLSRPSKEGCRSYNQHFVFGVERAVELITPQTQLTSEDSFGATCQNP